MASASELRRGIDGARAALRVAVSDAAARWETSPGRDEWSPRQTAEHAIGAEPAYAGIIARSLGLDVPARQDLSLADASEALRALRAAAAACALVLDAITDEQLGTAASLGESVPFPKTVAGVLQLAASHLDDHAQQIRSA